MRLVADVRTVMAVRRTLMFVRLVHARTGRGRRMGATAGSMAGSSGGGESACGRSGSVPLGRSLRGPKGDDAAESRAREDRRGADDAQAWCHEMVSWTCAGGPASESVVRGRSPRGGLNARASGLLDDRDDGVPPVGHVGRWLAMVPSCHARSMADDVVQKADGCLRS